MTTSVSSPILWAHQKTKVQVLPLHWQACWSQATWAALSLSFLLLWKSFENRGGSARGIIANLQPASTSKTVGFLSLFWLFAGPLVVQLINQSHSKRNGLGQTARIACLFIQQYMFECLLPQDTHNKLSMPRYGLSAFQCICSWTPATILWGEYYYYYHQIKTKSLGSGVKLLGLNPCFVSSQCDKWLDFSVLPFPYI